MLDVLKEIAKTTIDAENPTAVMFGTVVGVNPLRVNVDQRFTLDEDFLVIAERLIHYEVDLQHVHPYDGGTTGEAIPPEPQKLIIRHRLRVGDKVILLRVQGGQQYVVLDRVGEEP